MGDSDGKSYWNGWFRGTPLLGNIQIWVKKNQDLTGMIVRIWGIIPYFMAQIDGWLPNSWGHSHTHRLPEYYRWFCADVFMDNTFWICLNNTVCLWIPHEIGWKHQHVLVKSPWTPFSCGFNPPLNHHFGGWNPPLNHPPKRVSSAGSLLISTFFRSTARSGSSSPSPHVVVLSCRQRPGIGDYSHDFRTLEVWVGIKKNRKVTCPTTKLGNSSMKAGESKIARNIGD